MNTKCFYIRLIYFTVSQCGNPTCQKKKYMSCLLFYRVHLFTHYMTHLMYCYNSPDPCHRTHGYAKGKDYMYLVYWFIPNAYNNFSF